MNRWCTALLISAFCLMPLTGSFAQDAAGEFAKAMDAYKAYDYEKSCRRLNNFYEATRSFAEIPASVAEALAQSGKSESSLNQTAIQAENSREPAKACSDHFLRAIFLTFEDQPLPFAKEVRSALIQRELMVEQANPDARSKSRAEPDYVIPPDSRSMEAIVSASRAATSGQNCATDELMERDKRLVRPCVQHLLAQARKQKSAHQWTMARLNFQRAGQVNKMLGAKQDPAVAREVAKSVREIAAAEKARQ